MPIIGAHVSVAGGLYRCFDNAKAIGATAIQIFGASPRQWQVKVPTADDVKKYKEAQKASGLGPVFLHAAYLPNLGTAEKRLWHASVKNLAAHLEIAERIGANGLIFHIGSAKGQTKEQSLEAVARGMKEVLALVPGHSQLIMENAAGGGNKIGATPEEIGTIFHAVGSDRVKVCIDTQHAFASGLMTSYSAEEIRELITRCDAAFGFDSVAALHLNDSKSPSGSQYDRHENIGEGHIGLQAFADLAKHPKMKKLPWLLEVPGFDDNGPDKKNVDILKKICN